MAKRIARNKSTNRRTDDSGSNSAGIAAEQREFAGNTSTTEPSDSGTVSGDAGNAGEFFATSPEYLNPESAIDGNGGGSGTDSSSGTGKRRGRKPGTRNKAKAVQGDLTSMLFGVHQMCAALLKVPELALDEAEAKRLNDAAVEVMRHYTDVSLPPEIVAWFNLAMVGGIIYGPRYIAYSVRTKRERENNARAARAQTFTSAAPVPGPAPSQAAVNQDESTPTASKPVFIRDLSQVAPINWTGGNGSSPVSPLR